MHLGNGGKHQNHRCVIIKGEWEKVLLSKSFEEINDCIINCMEKT